MCSVILSKFLPVPTSTPVYLVLYVCVFEHQGQRSDVLPVHPIAASDLDGVFDAFVNLLGGGMPYVGHRAVRKRGQDLLGKNMVVSDQSGGSNINSFVFLALTLFMSVAFPKGISGFQVRVVFRTLGGSAWSTLFLSS